MTAPHPARWSPQIIDVLRDLIKGYGIQHVHDPFGGTGERLGALCDESGVRFTATDIEAWPDSDPRVKQADATDPLSYPWAYVPGVRNWDPECFETTWTVTSPVYPNGVADNFLPKDESRRYTYRNSLGQELHANNAGRYSVRRGVSAEAAYWRIHWQALQWWSPNVIVNVKDFIHKDAVYPLVQKWANLLTEFGYSELETLLVPCPGIGDGKHREKRVPHESVLVFGK